jgi:hypothetical protein
MKNCILFLALIIIISATSCSGDGNPVSPVTPSVTENPSSDTVTPATASDYYLTGDSRNITAYKAFGIFQVVIDPIALTGELIPARNAAKIGDTFDSDLTQFLTVSPCFNCLQISGINYLGNDQVQVGFAIKHPFADIAKRPDLSVFDVRGIILTSGTTDFSQIGVFMDATTSDPARVNVSLVANADGYTHHFDELALDTHYFDPPRNYDANINPYKRYFEDGTAGVFDPHNPSGYNVMEPGQTWETQNYIFNIPSGGSPIDFAFIADCTYGVSAVFKNRQTPYYFLPEFNRKEAWKVSVTTSYNALVGGNTASTAVFIAHASDWQAGMVADPNYPNTTNLSGLSSESDVKSVDLQIPFVTDGKISTENVISGGGTASDPYNFQLTVQNTLGAPGGNYYGLIAFRDDLQGLQGPKGIPENPNGFPYAGPEIYDYSTYLVFPVRVQGSVPSINSITAPTTAMVRETIDLVADVTEADGDPVTYLWEQIVPASARGYFVDPTVKNARFVVYDIDGLPPTGMLVTLRLRALDPDGSSTLECSFTVYEENSAPVCNGITTDPYFPVIRFPENVDLSVQSYDPDGDTLLIDWDLQWDGDPAHFTPGPAGPALNDINWTDPGFYNVACRLTENRVYPLETICSTLVMQEGIPNETMKIDDSAEANPGFYHQDTLALGEVSGRPIFHTVYADHDDFDILYCNNADNPRNFGNHQAITRGPAIGSVDNPQITGSGETIHVVWTEYDNSAIPVATKVMINSSTDNGATFGAYGGERLVFELWDPEYIQEVTICPLATPGSFALAFVVYDNAFSWYQGYVLLSFDDGQTWDYPSGGTGMFRDSLTGYMVDLQIKASANGVLHLHWRDERAAPAQGYYDWSTDNGLTWNTDMVVTNSTTDSKSKMAVADDGSAYFAWYDNTTMLSYLRRTTYSNPPILESRNAFFNLGVPNFQGIDVWVSPNAEIVLVPVMFSIGGNYSQRYCYSYNKGNNLQTYFERSFGATAAYDTDCSAVWSTNPNRVQQFAAWVDYRTSAAPNAHIYGDYMFLVERF